MSYRWALLTPWKPFGVMWKMGMPLLFTTRKEARKWSSHCYGYIKDRKDLRTEPHNWRMPRPARVRVKLEVL